MTASQIDLKRCNGPLQMYYIFPWRYKLFLLSQLYNWQKRSPDAQDLGVGIGIVYFCQEHITCFDIWHGLRNNNINKWLRHEQFIRST